MSAEHDPVPLRERIRDRRTGRDHEVLAREAELASAAVLRQGEKVVVVREMLNARVRVFVVDEIAARFVPVDPDEPVQTARLRAVPKPEDDL
ncbi:hypothetical protein [Methylobacterium sp. R2-1]|uniref:hypothetical protein n=1 Tax=Methylobacterium sp. R2-1 TaxID=2587064 RepID=UPI00161263D6|nr:hypothetical protein [Methylobacterium sp. R2-1]MBB2959910.1 hypothetical protein [Methylobacterium sp. R2-1]